MSQKNHPQFISNKALGIDSLSGGAQSKISDKISEIIKEDVLETKVIGLEGDWGSGKSNVIKMIDNNLKEYNYYTFVFDAWGYQEDLTRKSFLEQIIMELFDNSLLQNKEKWKKLESELLSKKSTSLKQKFPKIKPYWLIITFSVFLLGGLTSFYQNVLSKTNFFDYDFGILKPIISIYLLPIGLFIWGVVLIRNEYKEKRALNDDKLTLEKESKWDTLGKILYWFNGQDIESEEVENVIENDPSILTFRRYFSEIEKDVKGKLIIVFDNLDRLEIEKVKSLWSSIHTFFAEGKHKFNSWVIIPYNKSELMELFKDETQGIGFVEKSIQVNFRVTPPVVTEWESFFESKLVESFGEELISKKERITIKNIFDSLYTDPTIKPRKIIIFINDLVTLYKQWEDEIKDGKIKIEYIALFSLTKDKILTNPNVIISNRSYLSNSANLFENKKELDETIASLVFGIEKEIANEVLLMREFQNILREGNKDKILEYTEHSAFDTYFFKAYNAEQFSNIYKELRAILLALSDVLSPKRKMFYWNDFADKIINERIHFTEFNEDHKILLKKVSSVRGNKIIRELLSSLTTRFNDDKKDTSQEKYYKQLIEIEKFIEENDDVKINLKNLLYNQKFNPEPFLSLVEGEKDKYYRFKISCGEKEIESYFYNEKTLDFYNVEAYLDEFKILKKEYSFNTITNDIKELIKTVGYNELESFESYLNILKELLDSPLSLELTATYYSSLSQVTIKKSDLYLDAVCIGISNFTEAIKHQNFQTAIRTLTDEQIESISERIEWYCNYQTLIEDLLTTSNYSSTYPKLKDIIYKITINQYGNSSRLNINKVVKNYSTIITKVFDNDAEKEKAFISRMAGWSSHFNTSIPEIDIDIFKHLDIQDNKLIKLIVDKTIKYTKSLLKDVILDAFKEEDRNFTILKSLIDNNYLESFSNNFYSAFDDFYRLIAKEEIDIPEVTFWNSLIDKMDSRKLKSPFTSVRDILINEHGDIENDLLMFFEKGLILHGNLDKKADGSTLKFIIPLIKNDFGLFLRKKDSFLKMIDSSEHREAVINELEIRNSSDEYKDNKSMKEVAEFFKIKS